MTQRYYLITIKKEKNKWIRKQKNYDDKYYIITYHSSKKDAVKNIRQIGNTRYEKSVIHCKLWK